MEKNQPKKLQKLMIRPIFLIYKFFQTKSRVEIWLYENADLRIEGKIIGFDEYMNTVLDDAEEIYQKKGNRRKLGRIILKGDNISLICNISE
eukprot:403351354